MSKHGEVYHLQIGRSKYAAAGDSVREWIIIAVCTSVRGCRLTLVRSKEIVEVNCKMLREALGAGWLKVC